MSESASPFRYLRDARLSAHAIDAAPAWLWSTDGTRILWANAVGAAIFGAEDPAALLGRGFDADDPTAQQIARIATTLPLDAAPRLERLRGFGGELGRALTCGCSRISLPGNGAAVFIVAAEAAGPALPLEERVRRLVSGIEAPVAVFSSSGTLFHAAAPALQQLAQTTTLNVLGADALATHALRAGYASGASHIGALSLDRIGRDPATFLLATLPAMEETQRPEASALPRETEMAGPAISPAATVTEQMEAEADVFAKPSAASAAAPAPPAEDLIDRRHPLRFVWQMDAERRFTIDSADFIRLAGPRTAEALGRPWNEIVRLLGVDPQDRIAKAVASHDTWSGISVDWPVDGTAESLTVELSGLPVFDRNRLFNGYRGFGVCRDVRRISFAAALRYTPGRGQPAEAEARQATGAEKPTLSIVPAVRNVVPFPTPAPAEKTPTLTPVERSTFQELAQQLTSRLKRGNKSAGEAPQADEAAPKPAENEAVPQDGAYGRVEGERGALGFITPPGKTAETAAAEKRATPSAAVQEDRTILDRLPFGMLVYRIDTPLYANPAFLAWSGYDSVAALAQAGGLDVLAVEMHGDAGGTANGGQAITVTSDRGGQQPTPAQLLTVSWQDDTAHALLLMPASAGAAAARDGSAAALQQAQADLSEMKSILDTASDGVLVLDREGHVLSSNRSAEMLFGYDGEMFAGSHFAELFTGESRHAALDYLDEVTRAGPGVVTGRGREVTGRVRQGGALPLFLTIGRIGDGAQKFCAVLRDLTSWKKSEEDLLKAKRQAEKASSAKSEFLAKISHEIRTPLNSIIGFSEVMMAERFGPIANERYLTYLKDIHESGAHLVSLLNDLLDLSKIEAGKLELNFSSINLNELTQQCVALMQPQANQQKIIIRTSLPPGLPPVTADARSLRQILLNLLSNSIKFTGPGGQVIVSTAVTDSGDIALRVRDTGAGMSDKEIEMALEPFRQLATSSRWGSGGTGLGLPLSKALAEANRASFAIKSAANAGTLVEVAFPPSRVLAA